MTSFVPLVIGSRRATTLAASTASRAAFVTIRAVL